MTNAIKSRSIIFLFAALLFSVALLFCSCGGKKKGPEPEVFPNVNAIYVYYDGVEVKNNNTFDVLLKRDNKLSITVDGNTLDDVDSAEIDWSKLQVSYTVEDGEDFMMLSDASRYIKVFFEEGDQRTLVSGMPNLNRVGKYVINIKYVQEIEFVVTLRKEHAIDEIVLSFNENNQIADQLNSYEFESGLLTKDDYRAFVGQDYLQGYNYRCISVDEYKQNLIDASDTILVSDVDPEVLGYGYGTPAFEDLTVGEWFVCVYKEEQGYENVYSNVCFLRIIPQHIVPADVPLEVKYTFYAMGEYQNSQTTLESLLNNNTTKLFVKVLVGDEEQFVDDGTLANYDGKWEFADKSDITSFVATNGQTVDEANIVSTESILTAGNNKYVVLKFNYNSDELADNYYLVSLVLQKGEIMLPDVVWIGTNDSVEVLSYFDDNQKLQWAYSAQQQFYSTYFDAQEAKDGLSGSVSFALKDSSKYKFVASPQLADKLENVADNYKNMAVDENNGTCTISWEVAPLRINSTYPYEITDVQYKNNEDVVIAGDVKIIVKYHTHVGTTLNNLASMFSYKINGVDVDAEKLQLDNNQAIITVKIDNFVNDEAPVLTKITLNNNYVGKVTIEDQTEKEQTVTIKKHEITQAEIDISRNSTAQPTIYGIKDLAYVKKLNNHYNVVWKLDVVPYDEAWDIANNRLVATLTPINSFFIKPFDSTHYNLVLSYNEQSQTIKFEFEEKPIEVFVSWQDYTVLETDGNVVTKVQMIADLDAGSDPLDLNTTFEVIQSPDDEPGYAEIVSYNVQNGNQFVIVVNVLNFAEIDSILYSYITLQVQLKSGQDGYVLNNSLYDYYILKFTE